MKFIHAVVFDNTEFARSNYDITDWSDLTSEDYTVHCLYSENYEKIIYLEDNIHAPIEKQIESFLEGVKFIGEPVSVTKAFIIVEDGYGYRKDVVESHLVNGFYIEVGTKKYQIFDYENEPIYWNDSIIEFDTLESAERFAAALREFYWLSPFDEVEVGPAIPHNNEVLNATNLIPVPNGDDIELKEVE